MSKEAGRPDAHQGPDKTVRDLRAQLASQAADIKDLTRLAADAYAERALAKSRTTNVKLLTPHIAKKITFTRGKGGELAPAVLDEDGKTIRITNKAGSAANMTVGELVGEMGREGPLSEYFGSETSGTEATSTGTTDTAAPSGERFTITAEEASRDPEKYRQVRKRAREAGEHVQVVG